MKWVCNLPIGIDGYPELYRPYAKVKGPPGSEIVVNGAHAWLHQHGPKGCTRSDRSHSTLRGRSVSSAAQRRMAPRAADGPLAAPVLSR
eukprot:5953813-Pleurochrysis_carterae.AAC.1